MDVDCRVLKSTSGHGLFLRSSLRSSRHHFALPVALQNSPNTNATPPAPQYSTLAASCIESPLLLPWGITLCSSKALFSDYLSYLLTSSATPPYSVIKTHLNNTFFDHAATSSLLITLLVPPNPSHSSINKAVFKALALLTPDPADLLKAATEQGAGVYDAFTSLLSLSDVTEEKAVKVVLER